MKGVPQEEVGIVRTGAALVGGALSLWFDVMGTLDVPMQAAAIFCMVAARYPKEVPQAEVVAQVQLSEAAISRNLSLLAGGRSATLPGPGLLVSREDPEYRRRRMISLTPKGVQFAKELAHRIEGA